MFGLKEVFFNFGQEFQVGGVASCSRPRMEDFAMDGKVFPLHTPQGGGRDLFCSGGWPGNKINESARLAGVMGPPPKTVDFEAILAAETLVFGGGPATHAGLADTLIFFPGQPSLENKSLPPP